MTGEQTMRLRSAHKADKKRREPVSDSQYLD
ncbi:MAG: hypothetical protein LKCHEGNO_01510 [Burkholderiaceae bacterium]|nr:hypothetical protein [Burkholderiaceae bacterium]